MGEFFNLAIFGDFEHLFLGFTDCVAYVNEVIIITLTFDAGFGFIDLHFKVINYFVTLPNMTV